MRAVIKEAILVLVPQNDLEAVDVASYACAHVLDGLPYASTESFWQGLKFADEADRRRIAPLYGYVAKKSADACVPTEFIAYRGEQIRYATAEHWKLMERACEAKFTQDARAKAALLSTGTRPLEHTMRNDSRSIPGPIMGRIWMNVRKRLRAEVLEEHGEVTA